MGELQKILEEELQRPNGNRFKNKEGKLNPKEEKMRTAFGRCVSNIVAVPVKGLAGEEVRFAF